MEGKRQALKSFQIARKAADSRLRGLRNVAGSCFGLKRKAGVRGNQLCVTVYVKTKVATEFLKPEDRIPKEVRRHGIDLPTDVIVISQLRRENGFPIQNGTREGTLGCFGSREDGTFGVTCAHCIGGTNPNPATGSIVTVQYPNAGNYLTLGDSRDALAFPGNGVFPNFGDFDAGLVEVSARTVQAFVQTRPKLSVFRPPPDSLVGERLLNLLSYIPVVGWGAGTKNIIRGRIDGVFATYETRRFDLMIDDENGAGITRRGDSGMIWLGPSGQAFGIHMDGDAMGPNDTSLRSFAAFAFRIADQFKLSMLAA
jgi:hypothetical protein